MMLDLEEWLASYVDNFQKNNELEELKFYIIATFYVLYDCFYSFNLDKKLIQFYSDYSPNQLYWLEKIKQKDYFFHINKEEDILNEEDLKNYLRKNILSLEPSSKIFSNIIQLIKKEELFNV